MSIIKGVSAVAGFKKASTWGTAVALGAGNGIGLISEALSADVQLIEDEQLEGSAQQRSGEAGNRMFSGEVTTGARYEGLEYMLAQVFGTAGAPTTVDTSAKKHVFKLNTDRTGIFGTFAIDKGFEVHEFTTVKLNGFSLAIKPGERAQITFRMSAHDMNINTSSGTNNNTTMATVTYPSNREYLQFKHLTVDCNAQSGAAFDATTKKYVAGVTIDVDRGDKNDDITTQFGNRIDEPEHDSWTVSKVMLDLSKYNDAATGGSADLVAAQLAKTPQKMRVRFVGETLAGNVSQFFEWDFWLNSVQFASGFPNVSGPGLTPFTLEGRPYRVLTVPTGFPTGYLDSVTMEVFSQLATDPLA